MGNEPPVIEIAGLGFGYAHGGRVLGGLDFRLEEGERVGLVGPNGSGKSTLMLLIMGLLLPQEGEIRIFGKPRRTEEDFAEARRSMGFLFQDSDDQLFCPTVEEDIAFGPLNMGKTHAEAGEIVRECASALGISGLLKKAIHRLSGGEKRLAALATVIAMRPRCFLLDEPAAGLDAEKTALLLKYLKGHAPTCLISSHDQDFLKETTHRTFRLRAA